MACSQNQISSIVLSKGALSCPSCMGTVFLMSKIYFKMPFLKLWRWNQDTSPGPCFRWTTRVVIWVWPTGSNLYDAVSVNELSSSILKHGIHTVKSVGVSSCVGLRQHMFSCPEKMKSSRTAIRCKMWSFRRLCPITAHTLQGSGSPWKEKQLVQTKSRPHSNDI